MFEQAFKNIDDVLWKEAGCTTELDYTEQTSWLLFLKYLDDLEKDKSTEAALEGRKYSNILDPAYRWDSWAAPRNGNGKIDHNGALTGDDLRDFRTRLLRRFAVFAWINSTLEQSARLITAVAGVFQSDIRVNTKRQPLFLAAKAILQSPPLPAVRRNFR